MMMSVQTDVTSARLADWIDREEFPFAPKSLRVDGGTMRYLDEGKGAPIVFLHGTPTWSYVWRKYIRALSPHFRCVAPDLIGFGLSDKPEAWSYSPANHARNVSTLIEELDLKDVTLVLSGMGGPIGLQYLVEHADNVRQLVLFNTWCWTLKGDPNIERISKMVNGPVGRLMALNILSARHLMRMVFGEKSALTPELEKAYAGPFQDKEDRHGLLKHGRHLLDSGALYDDIWEQRHLIGDKRMQFIWGLKDPMFGEKYLARFWREFPMAEVERLPTAGHFVMEERPRECLQILQRFFGLPVDGPVMA